jgi:tetratricopeptide (TPR) repeat protein
MPRDPERWTLDGFLDHFQRVHETMQDHQFSWVIGAGASRSAGIPTGAELVDVWLRAIHRRECQDETPLEKWATAERLGIDGFTYEDRAASYPQIYERRFRGFPAEGFAYLEYVMTGKAKSLAESGLADAKPTKVIEPGPGYSILAKIMETQRHRVVITTNFDNLVGDALQVYTDTHPLVCGHEALAGFVNVAMRRPVICKIHRDLFLAPFNDPRKLRLLQESWLTTLRAMLGEYTPIVIGYGGNDDSLMGRLSSLEPSEIKGRLIWCYFWGSDGKSEPSKRIRDLVAELSGVLVPVPDFDRLLILLGARLGVEVLDQDLERRQNDRIKRYRDAVLALKTDDLPQMKHALRRTYRRAGWWWWQVRVNQQTDPTAIEAAYEEAVRHCPTSHELINNFANFMTDVRKKHDEAERLYRKAIELNPSEAAAKTNFAAFLANVRKKHDEAMRLYRAAIKLNPRKADYTANFAGFLLAQGQLDKAGRLIEKAIRLNHGETNQMLGELLVYKATLEALRGKSNEQTLIELRELLRVGFSHGAWTFEPLFASVGNQLPPQTRAILQAFGDAVLSDDKAATLEEILSAIRKELSVDGKPAAKRNRLKKPPQPKLKSEK